MSACGCVSSSLTATSAEQPPPLQYEQLLHVSVRAAASPAEAKSASDAGQMTPLFVMEDERIDLFPDTPTAVEKGVDFTWSSWKGLIGPKGMDEETLAWLRDAVEQVANDEQFRETLTDMGEFVTYESGEEFEARARRDMETTEAVLEKLGMLGMND